MSSVMEIGSLMRNMNFVITDYANPLLDTGFKQLMSLEGEGGDAVAVSVLNSLVPDFHETPIKSLRAASTDVPLTADRTSRTLCMDFYAIDERGEHIILEVQLHRHIGFDERALFYAARTYSNQFSSQYLAEGIWYERLRKTYSIQLVDYDSNKIVGINHPTMEDVLVKRVAKNPMKDGDFIKHYVMTDRFSGQQIDHLQMIQIELPRAEVLNLFPPNADFTVQRWWLSILNHSKEYATEYIEKLYKEGIMPHEVYEGLDRIKYDKWTPGLRESYSDDLAEMRRIYDPQITMDLNTAVEKGISIGKQEGISIGETRGISIGEARGISIGIRNMALKMLSEGFPVGTVASITGLSEQEILQLIQQ
jgi:hypothetical protein